MGDNGIQLEAGEGERKPPPWRNMLPSNKEDLQSNFFDRKLKGE